MLAAFQIQECAVLADQNFIVRPLPTIVFNKGASLSLSQHIQSLGKTAALIVTDQNLAGSGVLDPVIEALRASNLRVELDNTFEMPCSVI